MIMNGFASVYGLCLLLIAVIGWDVLGVGVRARGLVKKTHGLLYLLCFVFGAAFARVFYILTSPYGRLSMSLISIYPYEYAMSGAVLGAILGGLLTVLLTRQSAGYVLDAMTPAALICVMLARIAEVLADFGWGDVVEGKWARFPYAVEDMFGQWHLSVFFLSALLTLLALLLAKCWRKKRPGELFSIALCWFTMGQLFCETLRSESICWGFVRVQQLVCAVMALGLLIGWHFRNKLSGKHLRNSLLVFIACIGAIIFAQYAMDKLTLVIPTIVSYGILAAALLVMGTTVQKAVCSSKENILIRVKYKKEC